MISLAFSDQDQSLQIPGRPERPERPERPVGFPSRNGIPGGPITPPPGFPNRPTRPTFPIENGLLSLVGKPVTVTTTSETESGILLSVQADYIALVAPDGALYLLSISKIQTISES